MEISSCICINQHIYNTFKKNSKKGKGEEGDGRRSREVKEEEEMGYLMHITRKMTPENDN